MATPVCAQDAGRSDLPATADEVIEQMATEAGVIFAGQVLAVKRPLGVGGSTAEGVVEIDFRVDQAVRGCRQGFVYQLREWAGLWAGSSERYRAGQRLLMFLRSPDAQGLSSPVHGAGGAIPLRGGGVAPGPDDTDSMSAEWMVDLRWLQAQSVRQGVWVQEAVASSGSDGPARTIQAQSRVSAGTNATPREVQAEAAPTALAPLQERCKSCLREFVNEQQRQSRSENAGVSPLLRAMQPGGSGREDESFDSFSARSTPPEAGPWVAPAPIPLGMEPKMEPLSQVIGLCGGAQTGFVVKAQNTGQSRAERGDAAQ